MDFWGKQDAQTLNRHGSDIKCLKVGIWLENRSMGASTDFTSIVELAGFLLRQQDVGEVVILTRKGNAEAFGALLAQYPRRLIVDSQEPKIDAPLSRNRLSLAHWGTKACSLLERKQAKRERIYAKRAAKRERVAALQERAQPYCKSVESVAESVGNSRS